jgi:hypothetical protein
MYTKFSSHLQLAEDQARRKKSERDPFMGEDAQNNSLPLWTANGGGKDNFRGFDDAKRREILKENEKIMEFKKEMARRDKELEEAWAQEQMLAAQAMTAVRIIVYVVQLIFQFLIFVLNIFVSIY